MNLEDLTEADIALIGETQALNARLAAAKQNRDADPVEYREAKLALREHRRQWREVRAAFLPVGDGDVRPDTLSADAPVNDVTIQGAN